MVRSWLKNFLRKNWLKVFDYLDSPDHLFIFYNFQKVCQGLPVGYIVALNTMPTIAIVNFPTAGFFATYLWP